MIGSANSRMEATPRMHSATMVIRVVTVVQMVRPRLSLMEMLVTSSRATVGIFLAFSRMRSKITMVLLME